MILVLESFALTRRFGNLTVVDSLTLGIQSGETFGLLGPNGAGCSGLATAKPGQGSTDFFQYTIGFFPPAPIREPARGAIGGAGN